MELQVGVFVVFFVVDGGTVGQLELFGFVVVDLERGDVVRDVFSAQRDDGQVAQDAALVDGHRGGAEAHVHENAARALLGLGEHDACQAQRRDERFNGVDACLFEAGAHAVADACRGSHVEEASLDVVGVEADGVELRLRAEAVFLRDDVEDFASRRGGTAVGVEYFVDRLVVDDALLVEVFRDGVGHGVHAHAFDAHVDLADGLL